MNTVLLTAGVVALMAAVIGGGLKAFNVEVPVLQSRGVRISLGGLGVIFLVAAFVLRDDAGGDAGADRSAERYQRQVLAACSAVRRNGSRNSLGTPRPTFDLEGDAPSAELTYDRDRVIAGLRSTLAANRRRLELLFDKSAPDSLRDEEKVARERFDAYARESRAFSSTVARTLPEDPTIEQIDQTTAPLQDRADSVIAPLEDAMTRLAGRECSITSND